MAAVQRSRGVFLHGSSESWQQDYCSGLTTLPLLPLENKLSENPVHNTEPTINTDLCRIPFHCFQNSCGLVECAPKLSGPTCMCDTWTTQHNTMQQRKIYLAASWLFEARITIRSTKCLAPKSWRILCTPHFDALHLTAFPSAVPLIFHIRFLIITASRAICFWTNLPSFQINISRQVKWHLGCFLHWGRCIYNVLILIFGSSCYKNNLTNSKEKILPLPVLNAHTFGFYPLLRATPLKKLDKSCAINKCNRPPCRHAYFVAL